jgi:hypothetical protein
VSVLALSSTPSAHGGALPAIRPRFAAEPLSLSIDSLTPSVIPTRGPIRVSGTITNTSPDTWDNVGVYPLTSFEPLTTPAALAEAARTDPADPVGDRITAFGPLDVVDTLAPGATATYSLRIPRTALTISGAPGVYWFGVQALGEVDGVREEVPVADGRARTFLPYFPVPTTRKAAKSKKAPSSSTRTRSGLVRTALVLPVRQDLTMLPDGRVDQVAEWTDQFGPEGRLRRLVDFGAAAGSRSLTWLVDPALPDAAASIAAGNLPYDLSATLAPDADPDPTPSPTSDPSAGPSEEASGTAGSSPSPADPSGSTGEDPDGEGDEPDAGVPDPGATPAQSAVALDWLTQLVATLGSAGSTRVLALPYGDLDVAATAVRAPTLLGAARERSDAAMTRLKLSSRPAIAPPGGSLPPAAYSAIEPTETLLVTHRSFAEDPPERADVDGRILTTAPYVAEGPPPADPRSPVSIRQMILSEAAVRLLRDTEAEHSYVVQLPPLWEPPDSTAAAAFFSGLDDLDWFQLVPLASAATQSASTVRPGDLVYPDRQVERELTADTVSAASDLVASGVSLQTALTRNDVVAERVLDVALTSVSYADRNAPRTARVVAERNRRWIADLLGEITITGPPSLTLSSESGPLPATVTNGLDYPVTVRVVGRGDEAITVTGPRRIRLAPGERVSVILEVSAATLGVHNLELLLTDADGAPLGGATSLPVRSAQVGQVIWVIIGVGITLLFAAIVVRLWRRVRASRDGGSV